MKNEKWKQKQKQTVNVPSACDSHNRVLQSMNLIIIILFFQIK